MTTFLPQTFTCSGCGEHVSYGPAVANDLGYFCSDCESDGRAYQWGGPFINPRHEFCIPPHHCDHPEDFPSDDIQCVGPYTPMVGSQVGTLEEEEFDLVSQYG